MPCIEFSIIVENSWRAWPVSIVLDNACVTWYSPALSLSLRCITCLTMHRIRGMLPRFDGRCRTVSMTNHDTMYRCDCQGAIAAIDRGDLACRFFSKSYKRAQSLGYAGMPSNVHWLGYDIAVISLIPL